MANSNIDKSLVAEINNPQNLAQTHTKSQVSFISPLLHFDNREINLQVHRSASMAERDTFIYVAKLAEQAERYDG